MAGLTAPRPLTANDDRMRFDRGREALNNWFHRHAWRNQDASVSRTSILEEPTSGTITGDVSLSATQIRREHLAKSAQRNRPDPVPAILLGQLAVDRRWQGRGYARSLPRFALTTCVRLSRDIGCFGVLTHPLDEAARGFYRRSGFEALPFDPGQAMIARIVDLARSGFEVTD
jgi:GNAT superfamily N-acetyltransferase